MGELDEIHKRQNIVFNQLKTAIINMRKAFAIMDKDVSWIVKKEREWTTNIPDKYIPKVKEHEAIRQKPYSELEKWYIGKKAEAKDNAKPLDDYGPDPAFQFTKKH